MASIVNTFTDTINVSYTGNGKVVTTPLGTYTGSKDAGVATVIPAGSTNLEIDVSFPHATIQAFIMTSDQTLTVNVNSTTTPTPAISLAKTAPLVYGSDFVQANIFTADVTKFFVTNAGATDAKFNFRVLYN
jgi:hypothetical protein